MKSHRIAEPALIFQLSEVEKIDRGYKGNIKMSFIKAAGA